MKKETLLLIITFFCLFTTIHSTEVSGDVSGNWTVDDSPYFLVGDINIQEDSSLNIESGIEIISTGDYRINVFGQITAIGETQPITFSGQDNTDWQGIRLENEILVSKFDNCTIKDVSGSNTSGIKSINSPVEINNCVFDDNDIAVTFFAIGSDNPNFATICNSYISNCQASGIKIEENTNIKIINTDISNCALDGEYKGAIQISIQSADAECYPEIISCNIHDNNRQGIISIDMFDTGNLKPIIKDCQISNNLSGTYFYKSEGVVENCEIINNFEAGNSNSGAGIMLYGESSNAIITNSTLTGNYTGLYIVNDASVNMGNLNNASIYDDGNNNIFDNVDPTGATNSLYCDTSGELFSENCFWDSENIEEIDATITDAEDGSGSSSVDFQPIASSLNTTISGDISYSGDLLVDSLVIVAQDVENNHYYEITKSETGNFSIPLDHAGEYFVYVKAFTNDSIFPEIHGMYPELYSPETVEIEINETADNINIELQEAHEYLEVNITEQTEINDEQCYLFEISDYLNRIDQKFKLLDSENSAKFHSFQIPDENGSFEEIFVDEEAYFWKFDPNTEWITADINDEICYYQTEIGRNGIFNEYNETNSVYEIELFEDGNLFQKRWFKYTLGLYKIKNIDENGVQSIISMIDHNYPETYTSFMPMTLNNYMLYEIINKPAYPTDLTADSYFVSDESEEITFYVDPPYAENAEFLGYNLYRNNTMVETEAQDLTFSLPQIVGEDTYYITYQYENFESLPSNSIIITTETSNNDEINPLEFAINNYPNPFIKSSNRNSNLKLSYTLPAESDVKISIFNIKGQLVKSFFREDNPSGNHSVEWDCSSNNKKQVNSGVYFYKVETESKSITKKLLIIK